MNKLKVYAEKNDNSHALGEGAEIFNLSSEYEVAQLCVCEKDYEEHDSKAGDVLRAARKCRLQLSHRSIKAVQ